MKAAIEFLQQPLSGQVTICISWPKGKQKYPVHGGSARKHGTLDVCLASSTAMASFTFIVSVRS